MKRNINIKVHKWLPIFSFIIIQTLSAHPHSRTDLKIHPHTHIQDEHDLKYDLDEFNDLDLQSSKHIRSNTTTINNENQRIILFDDNLYLLDDDFDFGDDEFDLKKLEIKADDMETANEYEAFLNAFFGNTQSIGSSVYGDKKPSKRKIKKGGRGKINKGGRPLSSSPTDTFTPTGKLGFGVSTILGASIPIGQNLTSNFSIGSNFGLRINTPVSFNLGTMEAKVGTDIYFSSMTSSVSGGAPYKLTNLVANVGVFPISSISSLEIRPGIGISPSSIGDYAKMSITLPIDINYFLPFNLAGFRFAVNLHIQETLGIPTDIGTEDTGGGKATSEFINFGLFINTPLVF